jgi:hypothetical protein
LPVTNPTQVQDVSRQLSSYGFREEHLMLKDIPAGRALYVLYVKQDDGR